MPLYIPTKFLIALWPSIYICTNKGFKLQIDTQTLIFFFLLSRGEYGLLPYLEVKTVSDYQLTDRENYSLLVVSSLLATFYGF